jgi:threonine aldolase
MTIDLRSDTVTKPTKGMLEAMMNAKVGDDVFGEDPTVIALEENLANTFGMEAGLFCPSGTMTNQIAIRIQTQPQDEVICDKRSHIYLYEGGGIAYNSLISTRLVEGKRGIFTSQDILENINPDNIHHPVTTLVSLENTVNKGGGCYYTLREIADISRVCKEKGLKLHLDGARVFNALVETKEDPASYGLYFDTISVCLSKGLGAPVGSVLLGSNEAIKKAKRVRKVLGGGMRQAGFLAEACIYALDNHIARLKEDHKRARILGENLKNLPFVRELLPVETNIVIFELVEGVTPQEFLHQLSLHGILAVPFGNQEVRFVTHLDFDDIMLEKVIDSLNLLKFDKQAV